MLVVRGVPWSARRRQRRWPRVAVEPEPVALRPGWTVAPPDFIGIGAQKAGTSWWYRLLASHPDVHDPVGVPKERHFFDGHWARPLTVADRERYVRLFPRPPGTLAGEWTPRYMHDFWVPPLLAAAAPGAKWLVLLRDPVDRYVSGLAHDLARGAPDHPLVAGDAFARGLYARQIERVLAHIDPTHLLVLQYERCRADVAGQLRRTHSFLGLDPTDPPEAADEPVNPTRTTKPDVPPAVRGQLLEAYRADAERLVTLVPDIDLDLWTGLRH